MRGFLEILYGVINCRIEFQVPDVCKVNAPGCRLNHGAQVILAVGTVRAGAERQAVMRVVNRLEHAHDIFLAGDNAWQPKYRPCRIIRMNSHVDVVLVADRHDCLEEVYKVVKKFFVCDVLVQFEKFLYACHTLRFPAGQDKAVGVLVD